MNDRTTEAPTMQAEPLAEHRWLARLGGEWTFEGEAIMEPGQAPFRYTGTESVRSLGGLWFVAESHGEMPEGEPPATMILTLGYDPQKQRYVGTWIGSMMSHLWVYEGEVDAAGKTLTLDSVGPNMAAPGTMARFKDSIEFESDDHRITSSRMLGDDGQWHELMVTHYRRKS